MAIDLCLESAGWVAQFVEANAAHSILPLRRSSRARTVTATHDGPVDDGARDDRPVATTCQIRAAAADLPIDQARAIWLIDMCGCSYDSAAKAMGVTRHDVAAYVAEARRNIRNTVMAPAG